MNKNKNPGPIDVLGDITPITHQKIKQVDSDKWPNMTVGELYEQQLVLQQRIDIALTMGRPELVKQIQRGIDSILEIIKSKSDDDDHFLI